MGQRTDPYQLRARELAVAAGIDPDSRIGEGRGTPAWCTFRDAARKEHMARSRGFGCGASDDRAAGPAISRQPAQGVRPA